MKRKPTRPQHYPTKLLAQMSLLAKTTAKKKPSGPTPEQLASIDPYQRKAFSTLGYRLTKVVDGMATWHGCKTGIDIDISAGQPIATVDAHALIVEHEITRLRKAVKSLVDCW